VLTATAVVSGKCVLQSMYECVCRSYLNRMLTSDEVVRFRKFELISVLADIGLEELTRIKFFQSVSAKLAEKVKSKLQIRWL
jgi:hypothetical protein